MMPCSTTVSLQSLFPCGVEAYLLLCGKCSGPERAGEVYLRACMHRTGLKIFVPESVFLGTSKRMGLRHCASTGVEAYI